MKKLITLFLIVLFSNIAFSAWGTEFIAIKTEDGQVVVISKDLIIPMISRDGLSVTVYINSRGADGRFMELVSIPFKTRMNTIWWLKENFEPKCMTRKEFDKKCDPIDAPSLK